MKVIHEDTRQKPGEHDAKAVHFSSEGWTVARTKLYVGDYMLPGGLVSVDTKRDIYELAQNLKQQHDRFRGECVRAQEAGYELVVLVENEEGVHDLFGLADWIEPASHYATRIRKSGGKVKQRFKGTDLFKACRTMQERYGVRFEFCEPGRAGARVLSILCEGRGDVRDDA